MSKNYYLIRKNDEKSQKEVTAHIAKKEFDEAKELIKNMDDGIHLYQIACGWKVAIDYHNGRYFDKSIESFVKFIDDSLKTGDWILEDEYGVPYDSVDIVWKDIDGFSNGMTGEESDRKHYEKYGKYPFICAGPGEEVIDNKVRFIFSEDFC